MGPRIILYDKFLPSKSANMFIIIYGYHAQLLNSFQCVYANASKHENDVFAISTMIGINRYRELFVGSIVR